MVTMKFWFTTKENKNSLLLEQVDKCGNCNVIGIVGAINEVL